MKTAGMMGVMCARILACGGLLVGLPLGACTVFCYGQGDTVMGGRSFDIPDNPHLGMRLVPATAQTHGWISFDRLGGSGADGMNDQGLFSAVGGCAGSLHLPDRHAAGRYGISNQPARPLRLGGGGHRVGR